jgi:hypothetical protein
LLSEIGSAFGAPAPPPAANKPAGFFAPLPPSFPPPSQPPRPFGTLGDLIAPPLRPSYAPPPKPRPIAPETKRKAFFSFHFDDIMRVNNVRNAWKITHPESPSNRSFYDSSLWESRKLAGAESIKQVIAASQNVCMLRLLSALSYALLSDPHNDHSRNAQYASLLRPAQLVDNLL